MRIKVKRVRGGSIGDQRDYGLVTGSIWNYEDKPSTNNVSTTMTPEKDRENATIEAERGETVVGDLDNDGQLEHAKIGGKRHFEGGTPLNVPDGSFVFSDYNGLLIKNKELLANVFNYKSGKSATPAKVAKRYELNKYKDLLNDPNADFLDQKTAQLMIDNNLKKLGQLALVQESMKGFPDGIPNIAMPLFGSDMQAGGSMPQMKKGGLVKAQRGKQLKSGFTKHPAANNPLNYDNGMIYESEPRPEPNLLSDFALAATNPFATLMSTGYRGGDWRDYVAEHQDNPIDYALRTTAGSIAFGYPMSKVVRAAVPYNTAAAATIYDLLPMLNTREYGGQYMQTAGQKQPEPGFFESLFSTPTRASLSGAAIATAGYPIANLLIRGIGKGYDYISGLPWYQGKPAVKEVVPMINNQTKKPYTKTQILTKKGTPRASAIKQGKAVVLEVEPAVKPILGPRTQKVVKTVIDALPKKYRAAAYGTLAAAGAVGGYFLGDYFKEQDPSGAPTLSVDEGGLPASTGSQSASDRAVLDNINTPTQRQPVRTTIDEALDAQEETPISTPPTRSRRTPQTSRNTDSANYWGNAGYTMPADTSEAFRRGGMPLPKAQQGDDFVIQDPAFLPYRQDYDIIRPEYYPGWASVGSQNPGSDQDFIRGANYEILPTRGITNPKTGKKYTGIQDFINYANPYVNFEDYDTETNDPAKGIAQWTADMSSKDDATREKAGRWMIGRVNEYNQIVSGNPNLITIDPNKKGAWELGSENLTAQFLRKKQKQPEAPAAPSAPMAAVEEEIGPEYTGQGFQGTRRPPMPPWWKGDVAGFLAATGQIIPGYLTNTVRMTPSLMEPAYTEFDPSAYMGAYTTALQSMGTGPEGRGAALSATGAAGKTLEALNRERQANRAANLQTYLQAQSANMQALNQANLYNTEERKDYINRINTVREATARDINKKSAQIAEAYGKGLKNVLKTQNINAMFPYQYSDMNMGTAVNPTLQSLYDEPITGYGSSGSATFGSTYKAIYDMMIANGADPKDAAVEAARAARAASQRTGTAGAATSMFDFLG